MDKQVESIRIALQKAEMMKERRQNMIMLYDAEYPFPPYSKCKNEAEKRERKKAYQARYKLVHGDEYKQSQKAWYQRNKERILAKYHNKKNESKQIGL